MSKIESCILCETSEVHSLGTVNDYNKYTTQDPSGASYGVRRTFELLKCNSCGLWWIRDPEEDYESIYETPRYWFEYQKDVWERKTLVERIDDDLKFSLMRIPDILNYLKPPAKVLDIGCSDGTMLKALKDVGFDPIGIDLCDKVCQIAKDYSGCEALTDINKLEDNSYDLITALDVVEHLKKPMEVLPIWINKLKVNGIIFIEVPDSGCAHAINNGKDWDYVRGTEHIYYWDRSTLGELLCRFGVEVIESCNVWTTDRLRVIGRKFE